MLKRRTMKKDYQITIMLLFTCTWFNVLAQINEPLRIRTVKESNSEIDENYPLVRAEYFFNTDPGIGKGEQISIPKSVNLDINVTISVNGLTSGFNNLFIRVQDIRGVWSLYEGRKVYVHPEQAKNPIIPITKGEYFFNTDPGLGNGISLTTFPKAEEIDITQEISAVGIPLGINNLFIRTMDSSGIRSMPIYVPIEITISTNSANIIDDDGISIYPNPVSTEFRVEGIKDIKQLELFDLTGKLLLSKNIAKNESLNVENLQKGIYLLKINTGKAIVQKKLIKN